MTIGFGAEPRPVRPGPATTDIRGRCPIVTNDETCRRAAFYPRRPHSASATVPPRRHRGILLPGYLPGRHLLSSDPERRSSHVS